MRIPHAARVTNTVEELEDLYGALASESGRIAETGGAHRSLLARAGLDDAGELGDPLASIEEIAHHLVGATARNLLAQHGAHPLFRLVQGRREVAHPGWIEAAGGEQRLELACELLVGGRERDGMLGEMEPRAALLQAPLAHQLLDERPPERRWHIGEAHAPEAPEVGPGLIGDLGVKAPDGGERAHAHGLPALGQQHPALLTASDRECTRGHRDVVRCAARDPHELGHRRAIAGAGEQRRESFAREELLERAQIPPPLR
ncbi:MAG TPA: hypothetical protein VMT09_01625 [Steroidobacteraceae bacterium]|nr:hypothetical protein [Steroidobacteraceae bacterium]